MEDLINIIIYMYVFFLGTILGSFYNVVGIRVPEKESLMGRSHCPNCNRSLGWLELFPIVGYIALKGRCKDCKIHISVKYPLMEFLTGVLFLLSFVILRGNMVEYILIVMFISLMVIITVSDLYYKIVPDGILLIFLPILFIPRFFGVDLVWWNGFPWWNGLLAGLMGFGFMYLISWYGKKRFKQEALGGGDIKLYFLIGIVLGTDLVFLSVLFASLIAMIYGMTIKKKKGYIAFVPFIFAGSLLAYFVGPYIINWYIAILY